MVGPLLLIKMLHLRTKCLSSIKKGSSSLPKPSIERAAKKTKKKRKHIKVKPETKCRVCLKEGAVPIYGDQLTENVSEALIIFGGINIEQDDEFPKFICKICHALLQGAILLRKTAQQSEKLLKNSSKFITENIDDNAYADEELLENSSNVITENIDNAYTDEELLENSSNFITENIDDNAYTDEELLENSAEEDNSVANTRDTPEEQKYYNCKTCEIKFATLKEYCKHRLSEEYGNKRATCPYSVANTRYTPEEQKYYNCNTCELKFATLKEYCKHRLSEECGNKRATCPYSVANTRDTPEEQKNYNCKKCKLKFATLKEYCKHRLSEENGNKRLTSPNSVANTRDTPKEQKSYNCKKCEIKFATFKEYCKHRLSEEHGNKRVTCPVCNKSYTAIYYKTHAAIHNPEMSNQFICDICGKKFTVQGRFSRHRLTHFSKLPFKCTLCPYRGRFSDSLKMHMRSHTGEKPYQCSECTARFVSKSNLNKHMFTHKEQHDFKCESCDRGFYTKRNLELHIKVDHMGIKDHLCNLCGRAFGYRKQMMKHQLKVHKRQKLSNGRMPLYLQLQKFDGSVET